MKKLISLTLVFAICFMLVPVINVYAEEQAPMSMLHTEGNKIVNEEGEQITLRGTNLGGWLMQEGWMTPLGSGEIDHNFIVNITATVTNGNYVAANAIDTVTTNGITTNNMNTY